MSTDSVELFERWLLEQGYAPRTAQKHSKLIRLFIQTYLDEGHAVQPDEVDAEAIGYFLEHWYPRNLGDENTELNAYRSAFKRFYTFLHQQGKISSTALEEILHSLNWRNHYRHSHEPSEKDMSEGQDRLMSVEPLDIDSREKNVPKQELFLDGQLLLLIKNLKHPPMPMVLNFTLFLDYVARSKVKLTPRTGVLTRKEIININSIFSKPEDLPEKPNYYSSQRLSVFLELALVLGLIEIDKRNILKPRPLIETYLSFEPDEQAAILIHGIWNTLTWTSTARSSEPEFLGWAQNQRGGFAELISELTPGRPWSTLAMFGNNSRREVLANYIVIYEAVVCRLLFAFRELGILDFTLREEGDLLFNHKHPGISTVCLSRFGLRIMVHLTRKARIEAKGKSLVEWMQEELSFI